MDAQCRLMAAKMILEFYNSLDFLSFTYYHVKHLKRNNSTMNYRVLIAINHEGLHLFDHEYAKLGFYAFKSIVGWKHGNTKPVEENEIHSKSHFDVLGIRTFENSEVVTHLFMTDAGAEIMALLAGYTTRICA